MSDIAPVQYVLRRLAGDSEHRTCKVLRLAADVIDDQARRLGRFADLAERAKAHQATCSGLAIVHNMWAPCEECWALVEALAAESTTKEAT